MLRSTSLWAIVFGNVSGEVPAAALTLQLYHIQPKSGDFCLDQGNLHRCLCHAHKCSLLNATSLSRNIPRCEAHVTLLKRAFAQLRCALPIAEYL